VVGGTDLVQDTDGDHGYSFEDPSVDAGATYLYRLVAISRMGGEQIFGPLRVTVARTLPVAVKLHPGSPTPFNPSTTISFDLPEAAPAKIRIFGPAGHLVRTLAVGAFSAGSHSIEWDGRDDRGLRIASGVYLVHFETGATALIQKIVLAR
jgi:hypothetical protein